MSRPSTSSEARTHAIYAQLGVTFIQCYDQGKDTADKKIISDMWKFYARYQKTSPNMRTRIILLTGDRDFADAIGQLRNFGVEVGILTGKVTETAPVYDDYTLGMRVLPLMGVIEARARDIDLNAYQAGKRISLDTFDKSSERMFSRLRRRRVILDHYGSTLQLRSKILSLWILRFLKTPRRQNLRISRHLRTLKRLNLWILRQLRTRKPTLILKLTSAIPPPLSSQE